jgi:photoactive yellow protein
MSGSNPSGPFSRFDAGDFLRAQTLHGEALDALPFGVITLDRKGTIVEYNLYESNLSGLRHDDVIGRNFFHDVAPCTALREFEGRFEQWLDSHETHIEPFTFDFQFPGRRTTVSVIFLRTNFDSDQATICILRKDEAASS